MKQEDFEAQIKDGLKTLNQENAVRFAGICALRALPYLGAEGHFDYWEENDRQKHLYAVFCAIDANLSSGSACDRDYNAYDRAIDAYTYSDDVHDNYIASNAAVRAAVRTAARTAIRAGDYRAVRAAEAAEAAAEAARAAARIAVRAGDYRAVRAAEAAVRAAEAAARDYYIEIQNIQKILLQDLQDVKNGNPLSHTDTGIYGSVWDNFQKALANEGCAYWGRLYERLFANGFVPDPDELKLRMSVTPEKRSEGARAVAAALEMMEKEGVRRLSEARIIILGEKGAGKTCIARRLIDPEASMTTPEESTPGVDTLLWKLEKEEINVHVWDFAGHTVTHAAHRFFLSERCVYIMVYSGRTDYTDKLYYWLNHVRNYGGDSPVFILDNQIDPHPTNIPINTLKEKYPFIVGKEHTFSIRDDKEDLEAFRKTVADYIGNHPSWNNQQIPLSHFKVKEALEERFKNKREEHITRGQFDQIARENYVENTDELLKDLHKLGVGLWYGDMKAYRELVLNPEWISYGVYQVINWLNKRKEYSILFNDFEDVFAGDSRYPEEQYPFFFELMQRYELAYESPDPNAKRLIIPHLMPIDQPEKLPEFPVCESLALRYKAEQSLPPDTVPRFIVRHHKEIKKEGTKNVAWRHGAVLLDEHGNMALVKEDDRTISVSVKGKNKDKASAYLSKLRETLNDIFQSYKSDMPELQYQVIEYGEKTNESAKGNLPLFLPEDLISTYAKDKVLYYDPRTRLHFPLYQTFITYNISVPNGNALIGPGGTITDESTHTTINFRKCNFTLQGVLGELADGLNKKGDTEEARDLEDARDALNKIESETNPNEVARSSAFSKLGRIVQDLGDPNSALHKKVKGISNAIEIVHNIMTSYNVIAQWVSQL
jgi:GTPase SAR1 family protein